MNFLTEGRGLVGWVLFRPVEDQANLPATVAEFHIGFLPSQTRPDSLTPTFDDAEALELESIPVNSAIPCLSCGKPASFRV
jgi:hypothetical protein